MMDEGVMSMVRESERKALPSRRGVGGAGDDVCCHADNSVE